MIDVHIIPTLNDNYTYVVCGNDQTAVIDAGEAAPVIAFLEKHDLSLDLIINTHHHGDHIGGNDALKTKYGCDIAGPEQEASKIKTLDILWNEKSEVSICGEPVRIIETPGHTAGHICLYFTKTRALFSADTLFSLGCGRLFEGSPEQMWHSLRKLMALPDNTKIYCGHEYTKANAEFCLSIEPENENLVDRYNEILTQLKNKLPTIPTTLWQEKETNVFLRAGSAKRFAEIRSEKDKA